MGAKDLEDIVNGKFYYRGSDGVLAPTLTLTGVKEVSLRSMTFLLKRMILVFIGAYRSKDFIV